jgi:hypothetical protein
VTSHPHMSDGGPESVGISSAMGGFSWLWWGEAGHLKLPKEASEPEGSNPRWIWPAAVAGSHAEMGKEARGRHVLGVVYLQHGRQNLRLDSIKTWDCIIC